MTNASIKLDLWISSYSMRTLPSQEKNSLSNDGGDVCGRVIVNVCLQ
ncbi:MAG: hypothetical protein AAF063_27610 [Cyanobacteria bacterium J06643_5]